jgi:hypothetical protein
MGRGLSRLFFRLLSKGHFIHIPCELCMAGAPVIFGAEVSSFFRVHTRRCEEEGGRNARWRLEWRSPNVGNCSEPALRVLTPLIEWWQCSLVLRRTSSSHRGRILDSCACVPKTLLQGVEYLRPLSDLAASRVFSGD